jgi:tRNA(His) guanylyltransferase
MFDGKFQKLESLSAAYATVIFNAELNNYLPQKLGELPVFDARAFVVPNLQELYHAFLWRQQDATKNAISMAASAYYSHGALMGKSGSEKQEMLHEVGINFNDYPAFFKRGTFVQRVKKLVALTPEQLAKIPEQHRPVGPVERSVVETCDIWLSKESDPVTRLFGSVR